MKLVNLIYRSPSGRILLLILAILFTLCIGRVDAASEPGTITIVHENEPPNLDPGWTSTSYVGTILTKNVVEALTEVDLTDSSIRPKLATSWKQIDGSTWHFFLRKGVKFHDGADFNAEVVVYNIKRLDNKNVNFRNKAKFFSSLQLEAKVLDSHTVEIKTSRPEPLLLILMANFYLCSPNTPVTVKTMKQNVFQSPILTCHRHTLQSTPGQYRGQIP